MATVRRGEPFPEGQVRRPWRPAEAAVGLELVERRGADSQALHQGLKSYDNAAQSLSVHRNTLKYRLQRIREISGHDLSCPDTRFNLQLATRAWQTLVGLRSGT